MKKLLQITMFRGSAEDKRKLAALAKAEQRSMAWVLRRLVAEAYGKLKQGSGK